MKRASTLACSVAVVCGWTAACSVGPAACRPIPFQEIAPAARPAAAQAVADPAAVWITQASGVTVSLRGLSVVDGQTAWASGEKGTVIRTSDGGRTWVECSIAEARALDFRDLHAFDDRACVAVNAGSPGCVYRTDDGGGHWTCVYRNESPTIFFDALSFCGPRGWALSDPQDGRFFLITSDDGGKHWQPHPSARSPAADGGEACFAAERQQPARCRWRLPVDRHRRRTTRGGAGPSAPVARRRGELDVRGIAHAVQRFQRGFFACLRQ